MVAEVFAGLSAFKAMFDLAKGLKDVNDAAIRNAAVIQLQEQILAAQAAQMQLIERIGELEKEVASFEAWETEKKKYELKPIPPGASAYMLKPEARGSHPPHWVCTQCYQNRKPSIMQLFGSLGDLYVYKCPECSNRFTNDGDPPRWID